MEYKNILLKLSGEAISKDNNVISKEILENIFHQVNYLIKKNVKVSIVVGGGNIFRGEISNSLGLGKDTALADYMGMLATTINAMAINSYFNNKNLKSELLNSFNIEKVAKKVTPSKAKKFLKEGKVVIFGGGTGKPYVSTDTAAALRAVEINADVILMAKNGVDGAYSKDPKKNKNVTFFPRLNYQEIIEKDLKVIDHEMIPILKGKKIDVILFNMKIKDNIINLYNEKNVKNTIIKEI